jgi:type IV fimbrial biogenesis protein FimT
MTVLGFYGFIKMWKTQNYRGLRKNSPSLMLHDGFTLIEVMIVAGIVALVIGIASLSYLALRPTLHLKGATRQIMGDLMAARMKAVSLNNDHKIFYIDNHQYSLCNDANNDGTVDNGEGDIRRIDIQDNYPGVTFSSTNNLGFSSRGTANPWGTVTLTNSSGSRKVKVHITGRVKID